MTAHKLGIVVVSYHSTPDLTAFCEALIQTAPKIPVVVNIVSVETSEEETIVAEGLVLRLHQAGLTAFSTDHRDNCGYAVACNQGIADLTAFETSLDTYVLMNADTRITPGSLEHCVGTLWSKDDWGILGPRQLDDSGRITHAGIFGTNEIPRHRGWHEQTRAYQDIRDDCVTVSGSIYFVKRPVWEALRDCPSYRRIDPRSTGAFLVTFLYFEETFASYHATAHGYKIVYDGEITMIHKWHGAMGPAGTDGTRTFIESKKRFVEACEAHAIPHD